MKWGNASNFLHGEDWYLSKKVIAVSKILYARIVGNYFKSW